jgi:hypothetical protein
MAQEYHNHVDLLGNREQRQAFLADALRLSPEWAWDWVEVDFNQEARRGGDSGKSRLDFYTRNFPHGLDVLMERHPEVVLDGHFFDISMPVIHHRKLQSNLVLMESDEKVEWEREGEESRNEVEVVVVMVEGGLVQGVQCPEGVQVRVRDYDVEEGCAADTRLADEDGREYVEHIYGDVGPADEPKPGPPTLGTEGGAGPADDPTSGSMRRGSSTPERPDPMPLKPEGVDDE